ncbi:hypothetical protein FBR05_03960 [Deltaproteobacteria bacterium PRO3]|nr:hypothetical protein [Deltaproteobacteria bacterium PRO3]
MAGGVRGGRGAREIVGVRDTGPEARPRVGLSSLPGELGAERRLPEFAEAEAAKRRFDAGHREVVESEFHRAFEVFHERKGPGLFPGKKGFLFFPGFREVSPAEFASVKPKEESGWTFEGLWNAVQSSGAMILFLPLAFPIKPGAVDSFLGFHSRQFWFTSLSRALNLGLSPSSILNWLGIRDKDSGFRLKSNHDSHLDYDIFRISPAFFPTDFLVPKRNPEGFSGKDTTGKNPSASGPQGRDTTNFARHMDAVQVQRARMDELALRGFSTGEQLGFLKKLDQAPVDPTAGRNAAATFFERTLKISPSSWSFEKPGLSLPAYNAEILWDGHSNSWSFRPMPKANWTVWRGDELRKARHPEIPLFHNDSMRTTMRVEFLPEVLVMVDISLQLNAEGRRELVVAERFHKVDPKFTGTQPTWGRSTIP